MGLSPSEFGKLFLMQCYRCVGIVGEKPTNHALHRVAACTFVRMDSRTDKEALLRLRRMIGYLKQPEISSFRALADLLNLHQELLAERLHESFALGTVVSRMPVDFGFTRRRIEFHIGHGVVHIGHQGVPISQIAACTSIVGSEIAQVSLVNSATTFMWRRVGSGCPIHSTE